VSWILCFHIISLKNCLLWANFARIQKTNKVRRFIWSLIRLAVDTIPDLTPIIYTLRSQPFLQLGRPKALYTFTVFKKKIIMHNFTISLVKETHLIEKWKVSVSLDERERGELIGPVPLLAQHVNIPSRRGL
jgi:hypothetical protein